MLRANRIPWTAGSYLTDPANDAVLVTSPALPVGQWEIHWAIFCNAAALFAVQHLDTDGTTVIKSQRFTTSMASAVNFHDMLVEVTATGQKIRLVVLEGFTGNVQASLH